MSAAIYTAKKVDTGEQVQLAMQRLFLTGEVLPAGARLVVQHVFRSAERKPLEIVYAFPLPRDAALRKFRITGEDFEVHSELRPTDEAVKAYEQGLLQGSLAALAREHADGIVNLTVGNIRPGELVRVYLEIVAGVELSDGGFRFRYPFTLAPGYHAKMRAAESAPGEGEWELPAEIFGGVMLPPIRKDASGLHSTGFELAIASAAELSEVGSPSHAVRVLRGTGGVTRVLAGAETDVPDRDLVLDGRFLTAEPRTIVGAGSFAAVVPSTAFGTRAEVPRRVVILLDRSGSMSGRPIEQARRAIGACLAVLTEQDQFGIIAFDDDVELFRPAMATGTRENRALAREFLDRVEARGGTELAPGFESAAQMLAGAGDVFVVTDGQVMGTEQILARARKTEVRLHTLGIGSASEDRFLSLLARETGGVSRFVTARERVDLAAVDLFASTGTPAASNLTATGAVEPKPPRFVFAGTPVLLFGEGDPAVVELTWDRGRLRLPASSQDAGETVTSLRGARLIADAEARGESDSRLREFSERFGLASKAMSLVAVVKREGDRPGELPVTHVVPVGMPQDVAFDAYFAASQLKACLAAAPPAPASPTVQFMSAARSGPRGATRRYKFALDVSRPALDETDQLIEALGELEPDGGMPGLDFEDRITRTLDLLEKLLEAGNSRTQGVFRSHVAKIVRFFEGQTGLSPKLKQRADDLLEKARS